MKKSFTLFVCVALCLAIDTLPEVSSRGIRKVGNRRIQNCAVAARRADSDQYIVV